MPHATNDMSSQTPNGDNTSFKSIDYATNYPIVKDTVEAVKSHPYGKKSIEIADSAYQRFGKPVEPYLRTPYSYAKPYVAKADELAVTGLQEVDRRVPVLKEDTQTVIDTAKSYAFWPYNHYMSTYNETYERVARESGNENALTYVKALWTTNWHVLSDCLQYITDMARPRYEESKKKGSDYVRQAQDTAGQYKKVGQDKLNEYTRLGQQKADDARSQAQQMADGAKNQAQSSADRAKDQVKQSSDETKGLAKETKEEAKAKTGSK